MEDREVRPGREAGEEQETSFAVSDLKKRFEQLATGSSPSSSSSSKPASSSPRPTPTPTYKPPVLTQPRDKGGAVPEYVQEDNEVELMDANAGTELRPVLKRTRSVSLPPSEASGAKAGEPEEVLELPKKDSTDVSNYPSSAPPMSPLPPPAPDPHSSTPGPPLIPLATRPPPTTQKRIPPPPPASRKPPSATSSPIPPPTTDTDSDLNPPPPVASVRSLASMFSGSPAFTEPRSAPHTPPVTPPLLSTSRLPSQVGTQLSETDAEVTYGKEDGRVGRREMTVEAGAGPEARTISLSPPVERTLERTVETRTSRTASTASTSSTDSSRTPPIPPRPAIPARPVLLSQIASDPGLRIPPPIPNRIGSGASSGASTPSSHLAVEVPIPRSESPVHLIPATATASHSLSLPPPPPRKTSSPGGSRPTITSVKVPPRPIPPRPSAAATAPVTISPESMPYLPPPPPSRTIAPGERLTPHRPTVERPSPVGSDEESDGEEDETSAKSQEYPDSTFANRRPPILRNLKPIIPNSSFSSMAIRRKRIVTGQHHVHLWFPSHRSGSSESISLSGNGEHKVTAVEFRAADADSPGDDGRYVWAGTKEGHIFEVDTIDLVVSQSRMGTHLRAINWIYRIGRSMVTSDESGKIMIWGTLDSPEAVQLSSTPKPQRIADKTCTTVRIGNELWVASGPLASKSGSSFASARGPLIKVYDTTGNGPFTVTPKPITTPETAGYIGPVTDGTVVPHSPHLAYLSHDNGFVSVWNRETYACVTVQRVSPYGITAMVGVGRTLWAGFRGGMIIVYDVAVEPWVVTKAWKAHKETVTRLVVDPASLWTDEALPVVSSGSDMTIHLWDGLLREDWLYTELHLRQPDFCTFRTIRTLCISWNIDAAKPQDLVGPIHNLEFLQDALTSVEGPDVISFGFQEMIDLENKKLTAKTMLLGKKKGEQKFADGVSSSYRLWHDKLIQAVRLAMPPESPYSVVNVGDMVGLFSCIFVKNSEKDLLRDIALITVKTGMKGRYGNKGAIISRFVIDDTSLCFINCHLAAGQGHRRQRDHDLVDILEDKSAFSELSSSSPGAYAAGGGGTMVFDHEVCILSGDLNYRIDARRDFVLNACAEGKLEQLLPFDQLLKGLATNQSFRLRSFKEAPITFAPTYKYDPGTDDYDRSAKMRIPAWCDRVLWRADRADKVTSLHYQRYEADISDHRPISAAFDVQIKSIIPDKRAQVWKEVEQAWVGVESTLLADARDFYGGT